MHAGFVCLQRESMMQWWFGGGGLGSMLLCCREGGVHPVLIEQHLDVLGIHDVELWERMLCTAQAGATCFLLPSRIAHQAVHGRAGFEI